MECGELCGVVLPQHTGAATRRRHATLLPLAVRYVPDVTYRTHLSSLVRVTYLLTYRFLFLSPIDSHISSCSCHLSTHLSSFVRITYRLTYLLLFGMPGCRPKALLIMGRQATMILFGTGAGCTYEGKHI